jgi:hypothetical protein
MNAKIENAAIMTAFTFALTSCVGPRPASTPPAADPSAEYEQSLSAASLRHPDWSVPLHPLGPGPMQTVGTFTKYNLDTKNYYVWVSLPAQLWELCKDKQDPILRIQQILGLPPQPDDPRQPFQIILFQVNQKALFRPCPGGTDPQAPPDAPRCLAGNKLNPKLDASITHFLLNQFWTAHHVTYDQVTDKGNPEMVFGYPWTAMGWTYDWDTESKTHEGASEFVVKKGSAVDKKTVRSLTPAAFCHAQRPPED